MMRFFFFLIFSYFSVNYCAATESGLDEKMEIDINSKLAADLISVMADQEKLIAKLPEKNVAVFAAAGAINRMAMLQKESGKFNNQQFNYLMSLMLYRLSILSQTANMPPEVISCHLAEARNMEKLSLGESVEALNCRSKAYGPIQSEGLLELPKPSWRKTNELVNRWVVNLFSYSNSIRKISELRK